MKANVVRFFSLLSLICAAELAVSQAISENDYTNSVSETLVKIESHDFSPPRDGAVRSRELIVLSSGPILVKETVLVYSPSLAKIHRHCLPGSVKNQTLETLKANVGSLGQKLTIESENIGAVADGGAVIVSRVNGRRELEALARSRKMGDGMLLPTDRSAREKAAIVVNVMQELLRSVPPCK